MAHVRDRYSIDATAATRVSVHQGYIFRVDRSGPSSTARCTVERLMRAQGLSGARRGKAHTITTTTDDRLVRLADLVERRFRAKNGHDIASLNNSVALSSPPRWLAVRARTSELPGLSPEASTDN